MARYEGLASIRRALSMPNGNAQLDIHPDGQDWQWSVVPPDRAREALACGLAAIAGGWKVYVSLPDDQNSNVLEIIGLTNTADRGAVSPPAPGLKALAVRVTPSPVPVNRAVSVLFVATDATSGTPVAGQVKENGAVIGNTNVTFSHTFRTTRRRVGRDDFEIIAPVITVSAPGYADSEVDCGFPDV